MVEVAQAICVFTLTSKHPDKQVDHQDIRKYNRTRVYSVFIVGCQHEVVDALPTGATMCSVEKQASLETILEKQTSQIEH